MDTLEGEGWRVGKPVSSICEKRSNKLSSHHPCPRWLTNELLDPSISLNKRVEKPVTMVMVTNIVNYFLEE